MSPLLEISGLHKRFGGVTAVDGIDFHADSGEIVSVIGPNGAGKTTLFNIVTGFYEPDRGEMLFDGHSLVGLKPNQITKLGIARTFQAVRLFPAMTVLENATVGQHCRTRSGIFGAVLGGRWATKIVSSEGNGSSLLAAPARLLARNAEEEERVRAKAREVLAFFGDRLSAYEEEAASSLSYADRRRLEIARAMATEPKLLLLDEPTAGMNLRETEELIDLIGRLRAELGYTIIVIEHDMRLVKGVSDRVVALDYGEKIAEGTYEEVANNDAVIEAYLGKKTTEQA